MHEEDQDHNLFHGNISLDTCNYFVLSANQTIEFHFSYLFGGIPQNLTICVGFFFIAIFVFAILRKKAGNYGRLALVPKEGKEAAGLADIFFGSEQFEDASTINEDRQSVNSKKKNHLSLEHDKSLFGWVIQVFKLKDEQFQAKCGKDAVQYLRFQRHIIFFVAIVTFLSLSFILPINFRGKLQVTSFGQTTISNLRGSDKYLWVHIGFAILFFPLGMWFMRRFSLGLKIALEDRGQDGSDVTVVSKTLMFWNIPREYCSKPALEKHFSEAFPDDEIVEITIAYNVRKLTAWNYYRENARAARIYWENFESVHGSGRRMKPKLCGILCMKCAQKTPGCCCGCSKTIDARTFYGLEERHFEQKQMKEHALAYTKPTGIAFVTFRRLSSSKKIHRMHRRKCFGILSYHPESSLSRLLEPHTWKAIYAPPPEDIYWENITGSRSFYIAKSIVVNTLALILLFFFTTPSVVLTQLNLLVYLRDMKNLQLPGIIKDFVPTFLLWTLASLLPSIIVFTDTILGHWRRSTENLWIMRKVFIFLLLMLLILPSIGLTSLRGMVEAVIISAGESNNTRAETTLHWNCIFLPDNGAFFVNYVITSAIMGSAMELLRLPDLLMYGFRMCFARSPGELSFVRQAVFYEFSFGIHYSSLLLVFAMTMAYSVICPVITPFGLLYLIMKHLVDRYNMYYTYKRSKINKDIHAAAVNIVAFCLLLQQIVLFFFILIRSPRKEDSVVLTPQVIFSLTFICIYDVILIFAYLWQRYRGISIFQDLGAFRDVSAEAGLDQTTSEVSPQIGRYIPPVLLKNVRATSHNSPSELSEESEQELLA